MIHQCTCVSIAKTNDRSIFMIPSSGIWADGPMPDSGVELYWSLKLVSLVLSVSANPKNIRNVAIRSDKSKQAEASRRALGQELIGQVLVLNKPEHPWKLGDGQEGSEPAGDYSKRYTEFLPLYSTSCVWPTVKWYLRNHWAFCDSEKLVPLC